MPQEKIIDQILQERKRQDMKWGIQNHNHANWLLILTEEIGEAAKEANEIHFRDGDVEKLKTELIQSAAVIVSWLENIERR